MKVTKLRAALRIGVRHRRCGARTRGRGVSSATSNPPTGRGAVADFNYYRGVAAQHLYGAYHERIYKGQLPPLLYAIAMTETEIDENGNVLGAMVTRSRLAC